MKGEVWRPLEEFPGYDASNLGRIRSWRQQSRWGKLRDEPRILNTPANANGYRYVNIDGRMRLVHNLVLDAFDGPCPVGLETDHANGDKGDNRRFNLDRVTHSENQLRSHARRKRRAA